MPPQNLERPFIFQKIKKKTKKNNIGSVVGKTDVQIAASFFVCLFHNSQYLQSLFAWNAFVKY